MNALESYWTDLALCVYFLATRGKWRILPMKVVAKDRNCNEEFSEKKKDEWQIPSLRGIFLVKKTTVNRSRKACVNIFFLFTSDSEISVNFRKNAVLWKEKLGKGVCCCLQTLAFYTIWLFPKKNWRTLRPVPAVSPSGRLLLVRGLNQIVLFERSFNWFVIPVSCLRFLSYLRSTEKFVDT